MKNQSIYITASELAEVMGVSSGHAYKLIREMNSELKKQGYLTIAGKLPRAYLEKCLYGFSENCQVNCNKKFHRGIKDSGRSEGESL